MYEYHDPEQSREQIIQAYKSGHYVSAAPKLIPYYSPEALKYESDAEDLEELERLGAKPVGVLVILILLFSAFVVSAACTYLFC